MRALKYLGTRVRFPPPPLCNELKDNDLGDSTSAVAAPGQRCQSPECPSPASSDAVSQPTSQSQSVSLSPAVARIADAWPSLPPHIREVIQTLVDAASAADRTGSPGLYRDLDRASVTTDEAAWRMAQECRRVVQPCLHEEEWHDADREFFRVIMLGLNGYK